MIVQFFGEFVVGLGHPAEQGDREVIGTQQQNKGLKNDAENKNNSFHNFLLLYQLITQTETIIPYNYYKINSEIIKF